MGVVGQLVLELVQDLEGGSLLLDMVAFDELPEDSNAVVLVCLEVEPVSLR